MADAHTDDIAPSKPITPSPRPGAAPLRLDRYTANVIAELRSDTDTRIDALTTRVSLLEKNLVDVTHVTQQTFGMVQELSQVVKELGQVNRMVMQQMERMMAAVGSMAAHQVEHCSGNGKARAKVQPLEDIQAEFGTLASNMRHLSVSSTSDEAGPSRLPDTSPAPDPPPPVPIPLASAAGKKGKGGKGKKR